MRVSQPDTIAILEPVRVNKVKDRPTWMLLLMVSLSVFIIITTVTMTIIVIRSYTDQQQRNSGPTLQSSRNKGKLIKLIIIKSMFVKTIYTWLSNSTHWIEIQNNIEQCHIMRCHIASSPIMPCHATPHHAMSCHTITCYELQCHEKIVHICNICNVEAARTV